jgi:anti-anti-sigma factor
MITVDDPNLHSPQIACPSALSQSHLQDLERQIDQAILRKPESVCIDLSAVDTADSAGLEWLITTQSRLAASGIHMIIRHPSAMLCDVLAATRLDHRFQVEKESEGLNG